MTIQVSPTAIANLLDRDDYLTGLLAQVTVHKAAGWLEEVRQQAANWVRHSTIPTTREEEWRFTDLSALRKVEFEVAKEFTLSDCVRWNLR